jgi:hypothetical protein
MLPGTSANTSTSAVLAQLDHRRAAGGLGVDERQAVAEGGGQRTGSVTGGVTGGLAVVTPAGG